MILKQQSDIITFTCGMNRYSFFTSGDIFQFMSGNCMINQFRGNPLDGSVNNIYLRIYRGKKIEVTPLLGIHSPGRVERSDDKLFIQGKVKGIEYLITFACTPGGIWFWNIDLDGDNEEVDLVYGQDIGMGNQGAVCNNELYMSQYLDHYVTKGEYGYVVCSRQNQKQDGSFPYLQQGCLNAEVIKYSTDEMQFFGKHYKKTNVPMALSGDLENLNYQFELAYIAFQTEKLLLNKKRNIVFYGLFKEDHREAVRYLEYQDEVRQAYDTIVWEKSNIREPEKIILKKEFGQPYCSPELTLEEVDKYFPERILEEKNENNLISFFNPDHSHVVLQEKELMVERPHGNIIASLIDEKIIKKNLITSTNYMYGLFHAQVVIGNTDMNKMSTVNKGLLNVLKNTGNRIYIKIHNEFRILTLPGAYEMGLNYSRWYYKLENDVIIITAYAAACEPDLVLELVSEKGRIYQYVITNQLVMGNSDFTEEIVLEEIQGGVRLKPSERSPIRQHYKELYYTITLKNVPADISDDCIFYEDSKTRNGTMLTMGLKGSGFIMTIRGYIKESESVRQKSCDFNEEKEKYIRFYNKFIKRFKLSNENIDSKDESENLLKLNTLITWYTHNALVHFAVPHGLEQSSGAAWGTRDICQGPMELFIVTEHFELARNVLAEIFKHQLVENKEWPQWFMFDRYPYQAKDCHGDVILWPLKCLGDYLEYTSDFEILEQKLPYTDAEGIRTQFEDTVLDHLKAAVKTIENRFVYNTALLSYAGGDWDDTLQPADKNMKDHMVSSWTQALAYQVMNNLSEQIMHIEPAYAGKLQQMAVRMKEDFSKYLIKDGIVAGFAYWENENKISYMLHPRDEKTGIHYRLIPLTRSIISGLADKKQAKRNIQVIKEHLTFPDGVRLMDKPARYDGGTSRYFQRAEQAANVGREISLQYVHAHIRFIEAMAVFGDGREAYKSLLKVVPIKITQVVKNAALRQSNAYFSSSEGDFPDRYIYQENFDLLKTGEIEVKGGWRIYSSGSGIFIARLLGNLLGIRCSKDEVEIDPVLPLILDKIGLLLECFGEKIEFVYHIEREGGEVGKITCAGYELPFDKKTNKYHERAAIVKKEDLLLYLQQNKKIHIYIV